jgi:type I restriction enzyme S subunit
VREGWQTKALAEVCEIKPKGQAKRRLKESDLVSFAPMEDLGIDQKYFEPKSERKLGQVSGSYTYFADDDVLLAKITPCFENGKLGIARNLKNGIGFGSSEYIVFRPNTGLSSEYLYYFLLQESFRAEGTKSVNGAVGHKRVSKEFIDRCQIPIPPLPEQQRIVAILDEVFAGLATATANAEKNLKNARELFDSYLNSIFQDTTDLVALSTLALDITDGDHMPPPKAKEGVPFITISNIKRHPQD